MSSKNISLKQSYVNYFNDMYKQGLYKHNTINNNNNFSIKSIDELKNVNYQESNFQNSFTTNKKIIQHNMRNDGFYQKPDAQQKINIQKNSKKKTLNFLNRNQLNAEIMNKKANKIFLKDNRLVMNEIDQNYNNFYKQFENEKTKQNDKLVQLRNFNYKKHIKCKPLKNQQREFFDFKPENTRLTFQTKKKNNDKITTYQELTKEFNKPMFQPKFYTKE